MKKSIIFIVIALIAVGWGVYYYMNHGTPMGNLEATVADEAKLMEVLGNVEVSIPDTGITAKLSNGTAHFSDEGVEGDIALVSLLGNTKVSDGYDVYGDLELSSGESRFHYLAIFHLTGTSATHTSSAFVGDRVKLVSAAPQTIQDDEYELTLQYLDRALEEPPTAEPTNPAELNFFVSKGVIEQ